MTRPLALAIAVALLVVLVLRRPFVALVAGALVFWWQSAARAPARPGVRVTPSAVEPPDDPDAAPDGTGVEVRCQVAGPVLQRWVSESTGRGYEVPPEQGVPDAEPGMHGVVVVQNGKVYVMAKRGVATE